MQLQIIGNSLVIFAIVLQAFLLLLKLRYNQTFSGKYSLVLGIQSIIGLSIFLALLTMIIGFVTNSYYLEAVLQNSDNSMSTIELIVATWAGREGVLLLWGTLSSVFLLITLKSLSNFRQIKTISQTMTIMFVMNLFILFFNFSGGKTPFQVGSGGTNGFGISPSLDSFWQQIHPPLAFMAYSIFIFPYALGTATMINWKEIHQVREKAAGVYQFAHHFLVMGWGFLNLLIIAGSIWAYEANWNGFWAFDPIEVASLVMWLLVTVYFHTRPLTQPNSPLIYLGMTSGWVGTSLASFVVRSGLWEGFHGYVGIEKAIVFGSILLLSIGFVVYSMNKVDEPILPDSLMQLSEKRIQVTTWWILVGLAFANVIGLFIQLINNIGFENNTIPYEYYMALNGIGLFALIYCLFFWDVFPIENIQYLLIGGSFLLSAILFRSIFSRSIFIFFFITAIGMVLGVMIINLIVNISNRVSMQRIMLQIIHISVIFMILPYFVVDFSSSSVNRSIDPDVSYQIDEFNIEVMVTKEFTNTIQPYPFYQIHINDSEGKSHRLTIHQGEYKGEYWNRGTWFSESNRDIYFSLLDSETGYIVSPEAPINIRITEKPLTALFYVSLGIHVILTIAISIRCIISNPIRQTKSQFGILNE